MIISVQFVQREPVLIDPENYHIQMEARTDHAVNGYYDLEAAMNLLPNRPPPLYVTYPDHPEQTELYLTEPDSFGKILGIDRPDDDPELLKFLKDSQPAIDQSYQAISKPYILSPIPLCFERSLGISYTKIDFSILNQIVICSILSDLRNDKNFNNGIEQLKKFLIVKEISHSDIESYSGQFGAQLINPLKNTIRSINSPEQLKYLAKTLEASPMLCAKPEVYIHKWVSLVDNSLMYPYSDNTPPEGIRFDKKFFLFQLQNSAKYLIANRRDIEEMSTMSLISTAKWRDEYLTKHKNQIISYNRTMIISLFEDISFTYSIRSSHIANMLFAALKAYALEHGTYPDTLNSLVPDYLSSIPQNPMTHNTFHYSNHNTHFTLDAEGFAYNNYWRKISIPDIKNFITEQDSILIQTP